MEIETLVKEHSQDIHDIEPNVVISSGLRLYRVELLKGHKVAGKLLRRGRPLMFRSLEGVLQTLRRSGFKRALLTEHDSEQGTDSHTTLIL